MKLRFLYGVGGEDISEFTKKVTQIFFTVSMGFKKVKKTQNIQSC
jgi:hypothetical protein